MIRPLLVCLGLCVLVASAHAQRSDDPDRPGRDRLSFTATLTPDFVTKDGAYVGGEIVMHVQLVSSDPLKRVRLDLPVIEGVRADMLARPHTRQIEIKGDEGYSILGTKGYSHDARLAIVPVDSGAIVIPPITITGISERDDGRSFEFQETIPERRLAVHPRHADFAGDAWLVSRDVTIVETWSHEISEIQNGDTVRRTITLTVGGVTADDVPVLVLASNDGYRVLNTEVSAETEKTETGFIAHVEQAWDIYVETEDVTYIDAIQLPYWNPELAQTEVASVARQRVEPLKRDALALRQKLRDEALAEHQAGRLGLMVLLSLPAAALIGLLALLAWQAAPSRADLRLWREAKESEPLDFYGSFVSWARRTFGLNAAHDRDQLSALGPRAADQVTQLHRSIFGPQGGDCEPRRAAAALIWASRRRAVAGLLAAIFPAISRFLFLR